MQKANGNHRVFDLTHWDAHERSFKRLPRFSQHSQAKLFHGLVNSNRQNHLLYGSTNLCPVCQAHEEALQKVFTCPHPDAHIHHQKQLDALYKTLEQAQTPDPVYWILSDMDLIAGCMTLTHTFAPQWQLPYEPQTLFWLLPFMNNIVLLWLGRISLKWASAICQNNPDLERTQADHQWASLVIAALWKLIKNLWTIRNEVIHGSMVDEQAQRMLTALHDRATAHYEDYAINPNMVLG
jgi:hypothetical protein